MHQSVFQVDLDYLQGIRDFPLPHFLIAQLLQFASHLPQSLLLLLVLVLFRVRGQSVESTQRL